MPHTFVFTDLHSWGGMKNELDMKRFFSIVSMVAVMLASCGKNAAPANPDGPENGGQEQDTDRKTEFPDFSLKTSTVYFGDEFEKYITVIDTNTVIISADAPEALVPLKGEIILVPASTANPYGFFGKVKSITRSGEAQIETEPATLEDAFEELHIDEFINVSQLMDEVIDEDGNIIPCKPLPDEVWDNPQTVLDSLAQLPDTQTKAGFDNSLTFPISIALNYEKVTGELVLSSTLSIKIDISNGALKEYDISLNEKCLFYSKVELAAEIKEQRIKILPPKPLRLPFAITVGPLVLHPAIVTSLDMIPSGKIGVHGSFVIPCLDVVVRCHNGEWTVTHGNSTACEADVSFLDAEGKIGIEARGALQFGVFGQKLLAFGIDAIPTFGINLSGKISMDNKFLLTKEDNVKFVLGGSFGVYLQSCLLSSKLDNLRFSAQFPETTWELNLLDAGKGLKLDKKNTGKWSASGSFGDRQFMRADEKGFALFYGEKDDPVDVKALMNKKTTRSDSSGDSVIFEIDGDPSEYKVRPYNKVGEYYFYGKDKTVVRVLESFHYSARLYDYFHIQFGLFQAELRYQAL